MKNQYFGDINDFKKYGLIRSLSGGGAIKTAVCWMLTENDGKADGRKITYLREPESYRHLDPELFDTLRKCVNAGRRNVATAQRWKIVPSAVYYGRFLTDDAVERKEYFAEFLSMSRDSDLAFFDPDNGLEVRSTLFGTRNSSKYLFWSELNAAFRQGQSVLLYQHFPRVRREAFTRRRVLEIGEHVKGASVVSFQTSNVLFLLAVRKKHRDYFHERCRELRERWDPHIKVSFHAP